MKKLNRNILKIEAKGITLIALVITIIVLLILAGVSLSLVMGENGILKQAEEAKYKTEIAKDEEIIARSIFNAQLTKGNFNTDFKDIDLFNSIETEINSSREFTCIEVRKV